MTTGEEFRQAGDERVGISGARSSAGPGDAARSPEPREQESVAEALSGSEQEFRSLFENVGVGASQLGPDGRYARVNDRYCEITGYSREELLAGMSPKDLAHPDDWPREQELISALMSGRLEAGAIEKRLVRKDGTVVWLNVTANVIRDGEGRVIRTSAVVQDVTERKLAAAERERLLETLRENDRRKDEFLAMLSHELRNPLAPIRTSLYVLERAEPGSEQSRRAQAVIDRQVSQLTRLVDDLLDVMRISRGKIQLRRQRIELGEIARRTMDDYRVSFEASGIGLEGRFGSEYFWVEADATRMAQVIGNLLANAVKFTHRGGKVEVSLRREGPFVALRVRDSGVGIAPEMLGRLFEPFMQAPQALDRFQGGLGLGLAMVKGLVELHGGTAEAASEGPGRGAEFTVRVPLKVAPEKGVRAAPHGAVQSRRVLVIEDNVDAADSLKELLELSGHQVQVAYDGNTGLEVARRFRPEVVFCDIGLPGISGYDVARALRSDEDLRGTRLVALTGYATPEDRQRTAEAGFTDHVAKPPGVEIINRLIDGTA